MDSLPEHVLGLVFAHLTSPGDRLSALLVCKRFLSAAVAHSPALWESLKVSDSKGDKQGSFWLAHHRHVRSLHVATTALAGGPGVFLQLPLGLAGLPALQTLRIDAPPGRNPDIMQVWMKQAFQAINTLSTLRHLQLEEQRIQWDTLPEWDYEWEYQTLPLLLTPGALPSLQSLAVRLTYGNCKLEVPPGALRALGSLTRLCIEGELVRPGSRGSGSTAPCTLGLADLEGTTALRQLQWASWNDGGLSLGESEALSLLGRLEQLSVEPAGHLSEGIWAALPQLASLTKLAVLFDDGLMWDHGADPAPLRAVAACCNLKELFTNWLPPIPLAPCQLSTLTRLVLPCDDTEGTAQHDGSWLPAMPSLEALEVYGKCLPHGAEALPSLKSLHLVQHRGEPKEALESISSLQHLTSLHLEGYHAWPLPPGPYLSNLRSLALKWADIAAPIPPALADAQCLTSLKLFTREVWQRHRRFGKQVYSWTREAVAPPECWEPADVALLRALPSLDRVELVMLDWSLARDYGDSELGELGPDWQRSAQALAAQLPGVGVVGRRCTREEVQFRFALGRF